MTADLRNPRTLISSSLSAQISEAEHRLRNRRRLIQVRGATLSQTLHQWIRDPTLLLWAGGMGFLMGEFTQRQKRKSQNMDHLLNKNHSFFETALNIIQIVNGVRTFFTALSSARTQTSALLDTSVETSDSSSAARNLSG